MTGRLFVTGGGSGLGRAIASRYARAGWRVCVADVNDARGAETVGELAGSAGHRFLHCDVTRDEDLPAAARWLEEQWGGVDVVVRVEADIADAIYRAVSRRRFHVLPHRAGRITWYMKRFLPRRLYAALVRSQLRRAGTRRRTSSERTA